MSPYLETAAEGRPFDEIGFSGLHGLDDLYGEPAPGVVVSDLLEVVPLHCFETMVVEMIQSFDGLCRLVQIICQDVHETIGLQVSALRSTNGYETPGHRFENCCRI